MKKLPVNKKILRMLSRRQIVETSFSMLKDRLQIINKKARSITSFFHKHFLRYLHILLIIVVFPTLNQAIKNFVLFLIRLYTNAIASPREK